MSDTPATAKTAEEWRAEANAHERQAEESFERCDTDGFLSQWASKMTAQLDRARADIAERGGTWIFPVLLTLDGERVPAKLINGRYGKCWALLDGEGEFTGEFVGAFPKRESTLERKGYREGDEEAPADARIAGSGTGLSGAASCHVQIYRTDGK